MYFLLKSEGTLWLGQSLSFIDSSTRVLSTWLTSQSALETPRFGHPPFRCFPATAAATALDAVQRSGVLSKKGEKRRGKGKGKGKDGKWLKYIYGSMPCTRWVQSQCCHASLWTTVECKAPGTCSPKQNGEIQQMAMGQNPVPPVNIPIPTKIGSKMWCTYL